MLAKVISKIPVLVAVALSFFLIYQGTHLRWLGYEKIPIPTLDEYNYIWQALSIKSYGLPVAWSIYGYVYQDPKFHPKTVKLSGLGVFQEGIVDTQKFRQNPVPLIAVEELDWGDGIRQLLFVAPYFDHPPLAGFINSLGIPKDVQDFSKVKAEDFRKPALVTAVLISILLFIFLYQVGKNFWISTIGVAIYTSVPTYLLASRTAYLENSVPIFILLHLILLILGINFYEKKKIHLSLMIFFLSGTIGGLAGLAKESAVGFLAGSIILMLINKIHWKVVLIEILGMALPILSYIGWGLWLQKDLFLEIFYTNNRREYYGSLKFISMLEGLRFKNYPIDGWWVWGFISLFIISFQANKKLLFLILPLFCHFLTVLLLGSPNYPWYYLAMIPFLAGCSAMAIWQVFKTPNFPVALAFLLIPLSSSFFWGYSVLHQSFSINPYRLMVGAFIIILSLRIFLSKYRWVNLLWIIFSIFIFYLIIKWNFRSFEFIIANWGNLPIPSLPNF